MRWRAVRRVMSPKQIKINRNVDVAAKMLLQYKASLIVAKQVQNKTTS